MYEKNCSNSNGNSNKNNNNNKNGKAQVCVCAVRSFMHTCNHCDSFNFILNPLRIALAIFSDSDFGSGFGLLYYTLFLSLARSIALSFSSNAAQWIAHSVGRSVDPLLAR